MCQEQILNTFIAHLLNHREDDIKLDTEPDWEQIIALAERHNIGNMLYHILPFVDELYKPSEAQQNHMKKMAMQAAVVEIKQQAEIYRLMQEFESHQITCMPVKGCDTKQYYPKREYRMMSDIDVLYKPEQHKEVKLVMKELGYGDYESGLKHDHYFKPPYITVEMHRALVAANTSTEAYYDTIWERTKKREGFQYVKQLSMEEQYIYTMVHLLEHFKEGGIGVRFVMDIYIFLQNPSWDRKYVTSVFAELHISDFATNIEQLAMKWFGQNTSIEAEKDELLGELAGFIMNNGVYGNAKQAKALAIQKAGRIGYVKRVVFPNLKSMITLYPWLDKYPVLLPIAWLIRIVRTLLFRTDKLRTGVKTVCSDEMDRGRKLQEFYRRCGVWENSKDL